MVLDGGVEGFGQEAEGREGKAAGAAGRVADLEVEDLFGQLGSPFGRWCVAVGLVVGAGGRVVGQRAQRALDSGDGEAGPGVEAAGALAGAAPADEVPLAGEDDPAHEAGGAFGEFLLAGLPGGEEGGLWLGTAGFLHEAGGERGVAGPGFGAGAGGLAGVVGGSGRFGGLGRGFGLAASQRRARCRRGRRRAQWWSVGGFCRRFGVLVAGGLLEGGEEAAEGLVVHRLQAGQRQRGLLADGEEDDWVVAGRGLQFVVEQALVEHADVLGGEVGEVDGRRHQAAGLALADADLGSGQALQQVVDSGVGEHFVAQAGGLEDGQGAGEAVLAVGRSGGEQVAAVSGDGQAFVVRSFAHQVEQRQQARPGAVAVGLGAAGGGAPPERFVQAAEPVGRVVGGVVARQQAARFGEQDDDQAHGDAAGRAVDVGRFDGRAVALQRVAVALDQQFDGLAHALAERLGEFGLALAAVADGAEQRRVGPFFVGRPQGRPDQPEQGLQGRRRLALGEPEVCVPLAPGVEVEAGEQEPPLAAVRHQGQAFGAGAQPAEDAARLPPAAADADALVVRDEDGQDGAVRAEPELARADALAGRCAASPLGRYAGAAQPRATVGPGAVARPEAAKALQHEGDELGRFAALAIRVGVAQQFGAPPEFALEPGVRGGGRGEGGDLAQALRVQQQAAVAEVAPARKIGAAGRGAAGSPIAGPRRAQGRRTSTVTGKACASPARAWRFGSRRSTMRRRSLSNCSRASS